MIKCYVINSYITSMIEHAKGKSKILHMCGGGAWSIGCSSSSKGVSAAAGARVYQLQQQRGCSSCSSRGIAVSRRGVELATAAGV